MSKEKWVESGREVYEVILVGWYLVERDVCSVDSCRYVSLAGIELHTTCNSVSSY